jgi:hypothetical protein
MNNKKQSNEQFRADLESFSRYLDLFAKAVEKETEDLASPIACPRCGNCFGPNEEQQRFEPTDYSKKPYAYVDSVDRSKVYVAPERKLWLKEKEDKEWREFHFKHEYDIPLYTKEQT